MVSLVWAIPAADGWLVESRIAMAVLLTSILSWLWIGFTDRRQVHLILARLWLVIASIVVGHHFFSDQLFSVSALRSGVMMWSWSALAWSLLAAILLRQALVFGWKQIPTQSTFAGLSRRVSWYQPNSQTWEIASYSIIVHVATWLMSVICLLCFGSLIQQLALGESWDVDLSTALPLSVMVVGGIMLETSKRMAKTRVIGGEVVQYAFYASVLIWTGWQIAIRTVVDPSVGLVIATSIAAGGCFLVDLARRDATKDGETSGDVSSTLKAPMTAIGLCIIAVSSCSLLAWDWIPAVVDRQAPDSFVTWSVAAWWIIGAATSGWIAQRHRSEVLGTVSASLVPAVVFLLMPLAVPTQWWIWIQTAGVASAVYAFALAIGQRRVQSTIDVSAFVAAAIGLSTCFGLILGIVFDESDWLKLANVAGVIASVMGGGIVLKWNRIVGPVFSSAIELRWPLVVTLLSGHLAIGVHAVADRWFELDESLAMVWIATAVGSIVESLRIFRTQSSASRLERYHVGVLVTSASILCLIGLADWKRFVIGLVAASVAGLLATSKSIADRITANESSNPAIASRILTRIVCWYALVIGSIFVIRLNVNLGGSVFEGWTAVVAWIGTWSILWRIVLPDAAQNVSGKHQSVTNPLRTNLLADADASFLVLLMVLTELVVIQLSSADFVEHTVFSDSLLWIRVILATLVALAATFRRFRTGALEVSTAMVCGCVTLISVRVAFDRLVDPATLVTVNCMVPVLTFLVIVFTAPVLTMTLNRLANAWNSVTWRDEGFKALSTSQFAHALLRINAVLLPIAGCLSLHLLIEHNTQRVVSFGDL